MTTSASGTNHRLFYNTNIMPVPVQRQDVTSTQIVTGTSKSVTISAALAGSLLIAKILVTNTTTDPAIGTPAGWTLIKKAEAAGAVTHAWIGTYYKVAAGGETSVSFSWTGNTSNTKVGCEEWSGWTGTPTLDLSGTVNGSNNNFLNIDPSSGSSHPYALGNVANELVVSCIAWSGTYSAPSAAWSSTGPSLNVNDTTTNIAWASSISMPDQSNASNNYVYWSWTTSTTPGGVMASFYDSGNTYGIADAGQWMVPKNWKGDGTVPLVLYLHGFSGTTTQGFDSVNWPGISGMLTAISEAGYPILTCNWGGGATWGYTPLMQSVTSAITWARNNLGVKKTGKIGLTGVSMGGLGSLVWAGNNLSQVACVLGVLPVNDLQDMVTNNRGGYAASINTTYNGAYSDATYGATYNPTVMATNGDYGSLPIMLWNGSTDAVVVPATVTAFQAAVGSSCTVTTVAGAHADSTVAEVNTTQIINFMLDNLPLK